VKSFLDGVTADGCYIREISSAADKGQLDPELVDYIRGRIDALELSFKDVIASIGRCSA